jgi:hypothetical protein
VITCSGLQADRPRSTVCTPVTSRSLPGDDAHADVLGRDVRPE